jgi:predicted amidohydrolase
MTSSRKFRAGLLQMRSGRAVDANIDAAAKLAREAKALGADYIQSPEMTNLMDERRAALLSAIAEEEHDPSLAAFRELARELNVHFHVGSLAIKASPEKAVNRSFIIGPDGEIAARYDKIHMFDVELGAGESYRESNNYRPGETAVLADLPWGRIGLTICYDLRFPSLYRALAEAGADFLAIPAAFTRVTGEAHWNILIRARAIETGSFVLAAAQGGKHENGRETYGHSIVVDPWGNVLAEGGAEPGVVMAEIDPALVAEARKRIPSLQHGRRFELAAPPARERLHLVDTAPLDKASLDKAS